MKKLILTTSMLALLAAAPAAFAAADTEYKSETSITNDADGDSKAVTTTTSTDAAGTTRTEEQKVVKDVDSDGDYKKTTTTTSKRDPKGLFNSSKTATTDTVKKTGNKVKFRHTKKVNGDTTESSVREETVNEGRMSSADRPVRDDGVTGRQGQPRGEVHGNVTNQTDDQNYGQPYNH